MQSQKELLRSSPAPVLSIDELSIDCGNLSPAHRTSQRHHNAVGRPGMEKRGDNVKRVLESGAVKISAPRFDLSFDRGRVSAQ